MHISTAFQLVKGLARCVQRLTIPTNVVQAHFWRLASKSASKPRKSLKCTSASAKCKKLGIHPCAKKKKKRKKKRKPKKFRKSMWENPYCDTEFPQDCTVNARFDDLYYKESNKAKRKYFRTWVKCPKLKVVKKVVCSKVKEEYPPVRRRKKRCTLPKTACPMTKKAKCALVTYSKCPKPKPMPCKRKPRLPPRCERGGVPSSCKKPLAPYPAFSECQRLKPGEPPLSDCSCYAKVALCDVWSEWRKQQRTKRYKKKR